MQIHAYSQRCMPRGCNISSPDLSRARGRERSIFLYLAFSPLRAPSLFHAFSLNFVLSFSFSLSSLARACARSLSRSLSFSLSLSFAFSGALSLHR